MDIRTKRLIESFEASSLTQTEICEKTGINKGAMSSYLSGRYFPKQKSLEKLASALNVKISYLMGIEQSSNDLNRPKGVRIPVLGEVVAGVPIDAVEEYIDWEEITPELAETGEFFALKIKGDSMEPRIVAGDVVIVRMQSTADTGDVVIAMVNGDDACCKRFIKHDDGITLQSFNPSYTPMFFTKKEIESLPVTIIGKVIENRQKY